MLSDCSAQLSVFGNALGYFILLVNNYYHLHHFNSSLMTPVPGAARFSLLKYFLKSLDKKDLGMKLQEEAREINGRRFWGVLEQRTPSPGRISDVPDLVALLVGRFHSEELEVLLGYLSVISN